MSSAADRGGYHIEDLRALEPTPDEIEAAARWAMTHDVSEGFAMVGRRIQLEMNLIHAVNEVHGQVGTVSLGLQSFRQPGGTPAEPAHRQRSRLSTYA